jgi:dihydroneopterin aldolase
MTDAMNGHGDRAHDCTFVRDLVVSAIIGIHPHERLTPQPVRISFELDGDIGAAADSDDIAAALDYQRAASQVSELTATGKFLLVETLAEHIAALLLHGFPAAHAVRVQVEKPEALPNAGAVGVRIERRRLSATGLAGRPGDSARGPAHS